MTELVCVTGANGFVASWVVKFLLEKGYNVRGLVRSPEDKQKVGHLEGFEGSNERLTLVKGDLLDYESLLSAFHGCDGVFHMACPVPGSRTHNNPEIEILNPAINGTLNVLKACKSAGVKRVVMTSSGLAVYMDHNRPKEIVIDETCWSDEDYLRENKYWYMLGKTMGEKAAWQYSKENNLYLIVVCPTLVFGALLQPMINSSVHVLLNLINGSTNTYENAIHAIVDVKDAAKAHILVYEEPTASGRYLCNNIIIRMTSIVEIVQKLYPGLNLPTRCEKCEKPKPIEGGISCKKLEGLQYTSTPFEETIKETIESFKNRGILN